MHERFFNHGGSALSSILRNTVNRIGNSYVVQGGRSDTWRHAFGGRGGAGGPSSATSALLANSLKFKGRQLLDQEGLSCLLIVLFIDDPKIHTTRLHRILRNLCYHAPTRDWVVKSLLSILEKSNDKQTLQGPAENSSDVQPPAKIRKSTSKSNTFSADLSMVKDKSSTPPSWLNISMDAALGFRANVFQVYMLLTYLLLFLKKSLKIFSLLSIYL